MAHFLFSWRVIVSLTRKNRQMSIKVAQNLFH